VDSTAYGRYQVSGKGNLRAFLGCEDGWNRAKAQRTQRFVDVREFFVNLTVQENPGLTQSDAAIAA